MLGCASPNMQGKQPEAQFSQRAVGCQGRPRIECACVQNGLGNKIRWGFIC